MPEEFTGRVFEFQEDFEDGTVLPLGTSTSRRPDALVERPTISRALGPLTLNDNSEGLASRVWEARAEPTQVFLRAETDTGWTPWTLLFNYSGAPALEIALSFQNNGDPIVAMERATGSGGMSRIWIWFFDPDDGVFQLVDRAAGRNPRACHSIPGQPTLGDTLVFFISPLDNAVRVLNQADRYQTAETVFEVFPSNRYFLQVAGTTTDNRVMLVLVRRLVEPGRYEAEYWYSPRYPWPQPPEEASSDANLESLLLETIVQNVTAPLAIAAADHGFVSLELSPPILEPTPLTHHAAPDHELVSVSLVEPIIEPEPTREEAEPDHELVSLVMEDIVIHGPGLEEGAADHDLVSVELTDDF